MIPEVDARSNYMPGWQVRGACDGRMDRFGSLRAHQDLEIPERHNFGTSVRLQPSNYCSIRRSNAFSVVVHVAQQLFMLVDHSLATIVFSSRAVCIDFD